MAEPQVSGGNRPTGRERGAELVEFALALPLVLVLILGMFDFGLAFQRYEVITNAAREGARLATLHPGHHPAVIRSRVDSYCVAANLPGGCPDAGVSLTSVPIGTNSLPAVEVTVTYPHHFSFLGPALRLIGGSSSGTVNLRSVSTMRCEIDCR
jgi:Flp pilus assembly protein TadG